MESRFSFTVRTTASQADHRCALRYDGILALIQDVTTQHSERMGISHQDLIDKSNAYWVISKIKFKTEGIIDSRREYKVETWPHKPGALRYVRDYRITCNDSTIEGRSEWCILDRDTLAIRRTDSVVYPENFVHDEERTSVSDFMRFREQVSEGDYSYTYRTVFTDIDCNGHVNNLAYARMALNTFSPEQFEAGGFNAFEIHFISQTYFGNEISIYRKTASSGGEYVEGRMGEKKIFAVLFYNE
ncbi:MAG: hypothetical protein IJV67_02905 [Clostridia bacterium]|nr:hypothetical protein [Clostridia bacterium]